MDVVECRREGGQQPGGGTAPPAGGTSSTLPTGGTSTTLPTGGTSSTLQRELGVWGRGDVPVTARELGGNGTALERFMARRRAEDALVAGDAPTDADVTELLQANREEDVKMCTRCSITGLRVLTSIETVRFLVRALNTGWAFPLGALGPVALLRLLHRSTQGLALCAVPGVFVARAGSLARPSPVVHGHHAADPAVARYLRRMDPMLWPAPVIAWTLGPLASDGAGGDYYDICEHPWVRGYANLFPGVGSGELHVDFSSKSWCVACDSVYSAAPRPARDAEALRLELDAHGYSGSDLASDGVAAGCSHGRGASRTRDFLAFGLSGIPGYELGNNIYGFNTSLSSTRRMFVFVGKDYLSALEAPGAVAIATQLTIDRFPRLLNLARTSDGPVSASVFLRAGAAGHGDVEALERLIADEGDGGLRKVALHAVRGHRSGAYTVGARGARMPYPINALRNIALEGACSAKVLLLVDVDFVPSVGFAERIAKQFSDWDRADESAAASSSSSSSRHQKLRLAVLPSFDLCKGVGTQPRARGDMLRLIAANCSILSASDTQVPPVSHGPTNLTLWLDDSVTSDPYQVTFWLGFEPYYALRAPHLKYDERMRGWGGDKQVHALLLHSAGAEFHVLRSDFVAHMPHERAADWAGAGAGELQEQQTKRALAIMEQLVVPELEVLRVYAKNVTKRPLIPGRDPELAAKLIVPHRLCADRPLMAGRLNPRRGAWLWPATLRLGREVPLALLLDTHRRDIQAPLGRADWTASGRGAATGLVIGACSEVRPGQVLTGPALTAEMTCAWSAYLASLLIGRPFALVSLAPRDPWYMSRVHMLKSLEEASIRYSGNITAESPAEAVAQLFDETDVVPVSGNPVTAALLDSTLAAPDLSLDARDVDSLELVTGVRPALNQRYLWPGESVALSSFRWPCLPTLLAQSLEHAGHPNITGPTFHRLFGLSLPSAVYPKIDALFAKAGLGDALVLGLYAAGDPGALPAAVACLLGSLPPPDQAKQQRRAVMLVHHAPLDTVKMVLKDQAAGRAIEVVAADKLLLTPEEAEAALAKPAAAAGALAGVNGAPPFTEPTRVITPTELIDRATLYAFSRVHGLTTTSPATYAFLKQLNPRATLAIKGGRCHKPSPC